MIEVVRREGTVAQLHALDPFEDGAPTPEVWLCEPTDDAIVLGSRQSDEILDLAACERLGLSVVRRRSGGGAVLIRRTELVWLDVVLPAGSAPDDIRGSMEWIGATWFDVLVNAGFPASDLQVHRGAMMHHPWSDLVCFAGVGPGELLVGTDKLVGLSQRRTRAGIRVQSLIYRSSVAHEYRSLFAADLPPGEPPGQSWWPVAHGADLASAFAQQITAV